MNPTPADMPGELLTSGDGLTSKAWIPGARSRAMLVRNVQGQTWSRHPIRVMFLPAYIVQCMKLWLLLGILAQEGLNIDGIARSLVFLS